MIKSLKISFPDKSLVKNSYKIAVLTGSSGGIGCKIKDVLIDQNYLLFCFSTSEYSCIYSLNGERIVIPLDLNSIDINDDNAVRSAVLLIKQEFGYIDSLINCAGIAYGSMLGMIKRNHLLECIETNFVSHVMICQQFIRLLKNSTNPSIVNISSISAFRDDRGTLGYACSKAALNLSTRIMARELAFHNIRVNAVAPGVTDTEMLKLMDTKSINLQKEAASNGRIALPLEIANLVIFLISAKSLHLNGQIIKIDGGQLC